MDLGLDTRVVIVTGGTRGIGRAIALALAAEGARVVTCARSQEGVDGVLAALAAAGPGPHAGIAADVTTREGVEALLACARAAAAAAPARAAPAAAHPAAYPAAYPSIWGLVNNVGGSAARHFDAADEHDFRDVMEKNFFTALRLSQAVVPELRAGGGGAIVTIASIWGREAGGGPSYNVAKAAEISLGKAMARDLAKDNIRVNTVAPGSIFFSGGGWERRQKADPEAMADFVRRELPFGRFGAPEEVANAVAFLLSPRASWISGVTLPVDGVQGRAF